MARLRRYDDTTVDDTTVLVSRLLGVGLWIVATVVVVRFAVESSLNGVVTVLVSAFLLGLFGILHLVVATVVHAVGRQAATRRRQADLARLGGGDPVLGQRIADCDRRVEQLMGEVRGLNRRIEEISGALRELRRSRFRDRVAVYERAQALLEAQLARRATLIEDWERLRRDLEALAAANRADSALDGLDVVGDLDQLDDERARLTEAFDELQAADEVWRELSLDDR